MQLTDTVEGVCMNWKANLPFFSQGFPRASSSPLHHKQGRKRNGHITVYIRMHKGFNPKLWCNALFLAIHCYSQYIVSRDIFHGWEQAPSKMPKKCWIGQNWVNVTLKNLDSSKYIKLFSVADCSKDITIKKKFPPKIWIGHNTSLKFIPEIWSKCQPKC